VLEIYEPLVAQGRRELGLRLGRMYCQMARIEEASGKFEAASALYEKAIHLYEELYLEERSDDVSLRLAHSCTSYAAALQDLSRLEEALFAYDRALVLWTRLIHEGHPFHEWLARTQHNKATALFLKDPDGAMASYEQALLG